MPLYTFFHEPTQTYEDVFFHMNDEKIFNGHDGTQVGEWRRIYLPGYASVDTTAKIDPFSAKDFVNKTNKPDTYGSLLDKSKELSLKRREKDGVDIVQEKFLANYKKDTGKTHFGELGKTVEKNGFKVSFEKD